MVAAVGGLVVGYTALTAVVVAGVGAVVAGTPAALTVLTLVGGAYLAWQGVTVLRHPSAPTTDHPTGAAPGVAAGQRPAGSGAAGSGAAGSGAADSGWGTVARGVGVSGLNPKALLIFLALLPQFTTPAGAWPLTAQLALLGGVFTLTCAAFYALLGTFAHAVLGARPTAARTVSRLSGAGMLAVGLLLAADHIL